MIVRYVNFLNRMKALEERTVPELMNSIMEVRQQLAALSTNLNRIMWILVATGITQTPLAGKIVDEVVPFGRPATHQESAIQPSHQHLF